MNEWLGFVLVMGFFILLLAQFVFLPIYIVALNKGKKHKLKQIICSSLFVVTGAVSSYAMLGRLSPIGYIALGGLVVSWINDFLNQKENTENKSPRSIIFTIATYVLYTVALSMQNFNSARNQYRFEYYEIGIFAGILIIGLILLKLGQSKNNKNLLFTIAKIVLLAIMSARGISVSVYNAKMYPQLTVVVLIAIISFIISNALSDINEYSDKKRRAFANLSIITYYLGQTAIAFYIGITPYGWFGQIGVI